MPQLIPFYFVSQAIFALILIGFLLYKLSKYILPLFVRSQNTRNFIKHIKL